MDALRFSYASYLPLAIRRLMLIRCVCVCVCVFVWPRFPVVAILNKGSYSSRQVHAIKTGDGAKGLMEKVAAYEVGY